MSNRLILRLCRGSTQKNDDYIGRVGELTVDTGAKPGDPYGIRIHDGVTQGGYKLYGLNSLSFDFGEMDETGRLYEGEDIITMSSINTITSDPTASSVIDLSDLDEIAALWASPLIDDQPLD